MSTLPANAIALAGNPVASNSIHLDLLPIAVCVIDPNGAVLSHNCKAADLWGSPPQGTPSDGFCGFHRIHHPDGSVLPRHKAPIAEALEAGEPCNVEADVERSDGTRLWVLFNAKPLRDAAGAIGGAVITFQDISARRRAEERARINEELFRAIVDTTPECVKIVARDGTLLHMNAAGLRMVEAEDATIIGANTFALIAPEDQSRWRDHHDRVCAGERHSWEFDIIGLQGSRRHMETHAVPLRLPEGETAQLAVTRDITRRKQ